MGSASSGPFPDRLGSHPVEGNGKHLTIPVPVKVGKNINTLAVRVENTMGLRANETRTVMRMKR